MNMKRLVIIDINGEKGHSCSYTIENCQYGAPIARIATGQISFPGSSLAIFQWNKTNAVFQNTVFCVFFLDHHPIDIVTLSSYDNNELLQKYL